MPDAFSIVVSALLAMAVLLFAVSRILRHNPSVKNEEFRALIQTEFSRAKRLGKIVAIIEIELENAGNTDLVSQLTVDRALIRDYDHLMLVSPNKYVLLWPDNAPEIEPNVIRDRVRSRLAGLKGIKHLGVAIFPNHGEKFEQLFALAEQE